MLLADGGSAEVAAVGDAASVVGASADGEAVDVDAVAVPVGGHVDLGVFLGTEDRLREDTGFGLGAVDEDIGFVGSVGADGGGVVGDGHVDLEGVGGGDGAELDFGEITLSDDEVLVVDGHAARSVGVDVVPVEADEDVALGELTAARDVAEATLDGGEELTGEGADASEASADELLRLGVGVMNVFLVGTHNSLAFPVSTDDGTDFADEAVEDTHLNFTHSCKSF